MGCLGCSCSTGKDSVSGCRSNGGCASGGCNRHNTYDWITASGINDVKPFDVVEVSFKNGSRKDFFKNPSHTRASTGDFVLVESQSGGFDLGKVSLAGELVRMQMKRKRIKSDAKFMAVIRKAHERDIERLDEIRKQERDVMIKARAVARMLDLEMKVGDVEFQGDGRKCTFYYTAEGRVDFRELIRHYAREFKVKIEMRQIGARQESARIGGLGNCGRELCCSTWLSEFKSVNTAAARYQNLAINQTKLSGMCGRLKCCLNYELDTYIDALEDFPDKAERFKTNAGTAILIKTDVFKRLMFYTYAEDRGKLFPLHVDQVWEALDMLKNGKIPSGLEDLLALSPVSEEPEDEEPDFENVDNVIQLPIEKRSKKKKKKKKNRAESAAAAVEKAEQEEIMRSKSGKHGGRSSQSGPRREDNRQGGGRPDQRPNNGPRQDKSLFRREGGDKTGGPQRPPQGRKEGGDQRPPQQQQSKDQQRPPQPLPPRKDGDKNKGQRPPHNPNKGGGKPGGPPQGGGKGPDKKSE